MKSEEARQIAEDSCADLLQQTRQQKIESEELAVKITAVQHQVVEENMKRVSLEVTNAGCRSK